MKFKSFQEIIAWQKAKRMTCHGFDRLTMTRNNDASIEELDFKRD